MTDKCPVLSWIEEADAEIRRKQEEGYAPDIAAIIAKHYAASLQDIHVAVSPEAVDEVLAQPPQAQSAEEGSLHDRMKDLCGSLESPPEAQSAEEVAAGIVRDIVGDSWSHTDFAEAVAKIRPLVEENEKWARLSKDWNRWMDDLKERLRRAEHTVKILVHNAECLPGCDSYGHEELCPVASPLEVLVERLEFLEGLAVSRTGEEVNQELAKRLQQVSEKLYQADVLLGTCTNAPSVRAVYKERDDAVERLRHAVDCIRYIRIHGDWRFVGPEHREEIGHMIDGVLNAKNVEE